MKNSNAGYVFRKGIFVLIAAASFFTVTAQSKRDIRFAKCAAEDGMLEVQLGKLALAKATSNDVKMHAQHMIDDHGKANEELKVLAAKKNISLPTSVSEEKQKYERKLGKHDGTDFDKRYAKCMVHVHKKSLCKFKTQANRGDDDELKSWAQGKVPTLERHLKMWKETCKSNKKS